MAACVLTVLGVAVIVSSQRDSARPSALLAPSGTTGTSAPRHGLPAALATGPAFLPTSASLSSPPSSTSRSAARQRLTALIAVNRADRISVAAYDVASGVSVSGGSQAGMRTASLAKLQLLETILLQHQRAGTSLSDSEEDTVTRMIENSDNNAADATFADIGGRDVVLGFEPALGLSPSRTVPGSGYYWGLTRTSAPQQLQLLQNLVSDMSPLSAGRRAHALSLMRNVQDDQRWGVPVVADEGTAVAVKNGWLAVDDDDYDESQGSWAVNSAGVVTVEDHQVLMVVMTQHDADFGSGVDLVQRLAEATADAVLH